MQRHIIACAMVLMATSACAQESSSETSDASEVVARFGDQVITAAELDEDQALQQQLIAIRQQEYEITKQHVENLVYQRLVQQAAEAVGLSVRDYLQTYVENQIPDPTEQEVNAIMTQYRARLDPDPEKARAQVVEALRQRGRGGVENALREQLFAAAGATILLEPMRFEVAVADYHPTRGGGADAPVVLIEYTDFQCPFCSRVQPTLDTVVEKYGDNVRHVFKQLPLAMHAQAELAAEASLCAADQGKFWDLHKWLFANARNISRDTLDEQASVLGLDEAAFGACLDNKVHAAQVQQDMREAASLGISGTPGFVINGRVLRGAQPLDEFTAVIDDELRRAGVEVSQDEAEDETSSEGAETS